MRARHQRKSLQPHRRIEDDPSCFNLVSVMRQPQHLNGWIGSLFAVGSLLFIAGSILTLVPLTVLPMGQSSVLANVLFFVGSLPFSVAAYLQLYQSANSPEVRSFELEESKPVYIGWQTDNVGWVSSALQFGGTLLFNVNTLDALLPKMDWLQQDLLVWTPDILGSSLFLISGYLAFHECCQATWKWMPRELAWQISFINLLGCLAFIAAACLALSLPQPSATTEATLSIALTLIGAIAFLLGSLLSLIEARRSKITNL